MRVLFRDLLQFSLHGCALSDAALPIGSGLVPDLGVNKDEPDWREANVPRLFDAYCGLSGLDGAKLASFLDGLKPLGIGSSEDMTLPNAQAARAILDAGLKERIAFWAAPGVYRTLDAECRAACSGVKLFLDGSIGARTAAIRGPWLGGGAGILTYSEDRKSVV